MSILYGFVVSVKNSLVYLSKVLQEEFIVLWLLLTTWYISCCFGIWTPYSTVVGKFHTFRTFTDNMKLTMY